MYQKSIYSWYINYRFFSLLIFKLWLIYWSKGMLRLDQLEKLVINKQRNKADFLLQKLGKTMYIHSYLQHCFTVTGLVPKNKCRIWSAYLLQDETSSWIFLTSGTNFRNSGSTPNSSWKNENEIRDSYKILRWNRPSLIETHQIFGNQETDQVMVSQYSSGLTLYFFGFLFNFTC